MCLRQLRFVGQHHHQKKKRIIFFTFSCGSAKFKCVLISYFSQLLLQQRYCFFSSRKSGVHFLFFRKSGVLRILGRKKKTKKRERRLRIIVKFNLAERGIGRGGEAQCAEFQTTPILKKKKKRIKFAPFSPPPKKRETGGGDFLIGGAENNPGGPEKRKERKKGGKDKFRSAENFPFSPLHIWDGRRGLTIFGTFSSPPPTYLRCCCCCARPPHCPVYCTFLCLFWRKVKKVYKTHVPPD